MARFSAKNRQYLYRIVNRRADLALDLGHAWRVPSRSMPRRCTRGAKAGRQARLHHLPRRRVSGEIAGEDLDTLDVMRDGDNVTIVASARSFLHNQVRSMVGSLVWVGEGRWSAGDLEAALAARDRAACGPVAPPEGLYLVKVEYSADVPVKAGHNPLKNDVASARLSPAMAMDADRRQNTGPERDRSSSAARDR